MDVLAELWDEASRELGLVVDAQGIITAVDARAGRLGLTVGDQLARHVVPGTEEKVAELCRAACRDAVRAWEVALVVGGAPVTVLFDGRPYEGRAALLGSRVPQDYADAVAEGNRAVHEIVGLNRELARQKLRLEESNKGIRALHAELEQQADRLRTSAEVKGRLVAGVSHEFRTPLHSILGLSRLLLSGSDGPLALEQETQVRFIRDSAEELSRMINDMLDLSRLDSTNTPVRAEPFDLRDFMSAMRGTMAPLALDDAPGGAITATSDGRGHGTTMTLRLPVTGIATEAPAPRTAPSPVGQTRILLIDDNVDGREMLRCLCELRGHVVDEAGDGIEGVETALRERPDLAIVDLGLPTIDGYEVARRLRSQLGDDIRLVALSGYGSAEHRERAVAAGFDDHVAKPIDERGLDRVIALAQAARAR